MDVNDAEKAGKTAGAKRKNSGWQVNTTSFQEFVIFYLSAKTINSMWASIASCNPSVSRASSIIVLNKFLLNVKKKSKGRWRQ